MSIEQLEDLALKLCNLSHGDRVKVADATEGWVVDFQASQPVVYFPHLASCRLISRNEYLVKLGEIPLQPGRKIVQASETFKMPLDYALHIGFKHLVADRYEFMPVIANKYPWDKGGIWKVIESEGKPFLVKESETGNPPMGGHQLDNDGTEPSGGATVPTFDSSPNDTQKVYE
jgi:hypothetical protein